MSTIRNLTEVNTKVTPQTEKILGSSQVANSAGGFSWAVSKWDQLARFLILGTQGGIYGTYYASQKALTAKNAECLLELVAEDGLRVVRTIVEISEGGRAPKNEPAIYALALCCKKGNEETKRAAYQAMPRVCRIGTHLFQFVEAIKAFGGISSGTQRAIARWYQGADATEALGACETDDDAECVVDELNRHPQWLAYQAIKYQNREGWSHRDVLRLAKPGAKGRKAVRVPATDAVLDWITQGIVSEDAPLLLQAFEQAKAVGVASDQVTTQGITTLTRLISDHNLPRECVPTHYLNNVEIWEALLDNGGRGMPLTAMVRNLGKMSSVGLFKQGDSVTKVATTLGDQDTLRRARVHPLALLVALNTYSLGRGVKGSNTWDVNNHITSALDKAFYLSFGNVEKTNKRYMLALDVSGSMGCGEVAGMAGISPRVGSVAMSMITGAVEPLCCTVGFTGGPDCVRPLAIDPATKLPAAISQVDHLPFGSTDCAAPMRWALKKNLEIDMFIVYTDSETYAGSPHSSQALAQYRTKTGINAKLVVVGMVSNGFTIADPTDKGMLDVVGFDLATPQLISNFALGRF